MTEPTLVQIGARFAVERVLNSMPEGILLAACAWLLLRLHGRQNAKTRFAVWFTTLVCVAGLPLLSVLKVGGHSLSIAPHAELTVPAFWAVLFLALWIPVALIAVARLAAGLRQVRAIRRSCSEIDAEKLEPAVRDVLTQSGERRVLLLSSQDARVPAAIGFRHPAIVLPSWTLDELSSEELKPILIHEMAHLRRRDDWTNLFQKIVRALLFFHPAVWWIDARLSLEREMACDDAVLAATGNAPAYVGCLIGLLERGCARRDWKMAQAAIARAREASLRIARILESGSVTTRVGRGVMSLAAALCMICCGLLEVAPRFVAFAPVSDTSIAQSTMPDSAAPSSDSKTDLKPVVVPAMFHPAQAQHRPIVVHRKVSPRSAAAERRTTPLRHEPRTEPPVVMAKLNEPATKWSAQAESPTTVQMLMVVQTSMTGFVTAPDPGSVANSSVAGNERVVQIETVHLLEEDETGWHMRTYRVVMVVPVVEGGSMRSSI